MSILSQKISKKGLVIIVLATVLIAFPAFVFSSHKSKLYVDAKASGTQNGSINHPFRTIGQATDKAKKNTEIHISKGVYKENVEIKNDVELFGSDEDDVVIEARNQDKPAVVMNDDTKINKITVRKGSKGIRVNDDSSASIIECLIKDNDDEGIKIEGDGIREGRMVSISESEIRNNGGEGIMSGRRRLSITDNKITDNDGDGIAIARGSSAWIAKNRISDNDKSGMKLALDGANIWTKSNSIANNKREGIEVSFSGQAGRINIAKTKFLNNGRFAVARVQRAIFANSAGLWNRFLTFDAANPNEFLGNKLGSISQIFTILN